jgi:hypothetical protein
MIGIACLTLITFERKNRIKKKEQFGIGKKKNDSLLADTKVTTIEVDVDED